MRKIKALAVVRSMGPGKTIAPILAALRAAGHETYLLAEDIGQAKEVVPQPFEVVHDLGELRARISTIAPDVVISGLSWPRTLEGVLDKEAKERGIPLVQVEDYWGGHTRATIRPDLIVTIDAVSAQQIQVTYPGMKILVAGFAGILPVVPRESIARAVETLRLETGAKLIVLPDCGPEAEGIWPIMVESVLLSRTPIVLIPKQKRYEGSLPDSGGTWDEVYAKVLEPLQQKGLVRYIEGPTDEVVTLADATASGFSTLLMRAAKEGKQAITVWTPYARDLLKRETGLDTSPLMERKDFPVLIDPQSLDDILASPPPALDMQPFDPACAAEAITELLA